MLDNNSKWGDAREYDLCIVKEGEGMETDYKVMPEPKSPLPQDAHDAWEKVKEAGFNIKALFTGGDPFAPDADIPF